MADEPATPATRRPRAPWIAVGDIDAFLQRMTTLNPPAQVTVDWATQYGFATASPASLVNLLEQLGVIGEDGVPDREIWNEVRIQTSRQAALERLVRAAYRDVFDRLDVATATQPDLQGTFIDVFGLGDPVRYIRTFRHLCQLAGIQIGAEAANTPVEAPTGGAPGATTARRVGRRRQVEPPGPNARVRRSGSRGRQGPLPITVTLSVEIPADWTEEQIKERIATVARATHIDAAND